MYSLGLATHKRLGSSTLSRSLVTPTMSIQQQGVSSASHRRLDVGTFYPNQYKSCAHRAHHPDHETRTYKFTLLELVGNTDMYVSKPLGIKHLGLLANEKEYLAILLEVAHWRPYLQHTPFIIFIYHRSLSHLNEQKWKTSWQQKVFTQLLGLQYQVVYKKGSYNNATDALSWHLHTERELGLYLFPN
jgi:hypothetical protein